MLALRAAGEQLGWGFQLQSPAVVAARARCSPDRAQPGRRVRVPLDAAQRVATLEARHPVANAFLTGVLAVAIASPCTAPFMGASLGLAIALPAAEALAIFARWAWAWRCPTCWPAGAAVARLLPRPGAWMDTFRRSWPSPCSPPVAWLVWVLGQQSGIDGAGRCWRCWWR
jgi:thiol:disulfide interchange protein DsbD